VVGPSIHAVVILGTVLVPLAAVGVGFAWSLQRLPQVLGFLAATLGMGSFCLFLLMPGAPIAEWVFPSIGIIIAGLFVKNRRAAWALVWVLVIAAGGLCANAFMLRTAESGYTSFPASLYEQLHQAHLANVANQIRRQYPPDHVLPPGPVHEIAPPVEIPDYEPTTFSSEWHTRLTRLYRATKTPGVIWYPGGPVEEGAKNLQWKTSEHTSGG